MKLSSLGVILASGRRITCTGRVAGGQPGTRRTSRAALYVVLQHQLGLPDHAQTGQRRLPQRQAAVQVEAPAHVDALRPPAVRPGKGPLALGAMGVKECQAVVLRQVSRHLRGAVAGEVGRRGAGNLGRRPQWPGDQAGVGQLADADCRVETICRKVDQPIVE